MHYISFLCLDDVLTIPPCPLLLLYSTNGDLMPYSVVKEDCPHNQLREIVKPPQPLPVVSAANLLPNTTTSVNTGQSGLTSQGTIGPVRPTDSLGFSVSALTGHPQTQPLATMTPKQGSNIGPPSATPPVNQPGVSSSVTPPTLMRPPSTSAGSSPISKFNLATPQTPSLSQAFSQINPTASLPPSLGPQRAQHLGTPISQTPQGTPPPSANMSQRIALGTTTATQAMQAPSTTVSKTFPQPSVGQPQLQSMRPPIFSQMMASPYQTTPLLSSTPLQPYAPVSRPLQQGGLSHITPIPRAYLPISTTQVTASSQTLTATAPPTSVPLTTRVTASSTTATLTRVPPSTPMTASSIAAPPPTRAPPSTPMTASSIAAPPPTRAPPTTHVTTSSTAPPPSTRAPPTTRVTASSTAPPPSTRALPTTPTTALSTAALPPSRAPPTSAAPTATTRLQGDASVNVMNIK